MKTRIIEHHFFLVITGQYCKKLELIRTYQLQFYYGPSDRVRTCGLVVPKGSRLEKCVFSVIFGTEKYALLSTVSALNRCSGRDCSQECGRGKISALRGYIEHPRRNPTFLQSVHACAHHQRVYTGNSSDPAGTVWLLPCW